MTEAKQELLRIAAELLALDADISALDLELRALWAAGTGPFIEKRTQDLCGRRPRPSRPAPQADQAPPQASVLRQAQE